MLQPGTHIGPFILLESVGADACGVVWLAKRQDSEVLAWVHVRAADEADRMVRVAFDLGMEEARRLQHPNIRSVSHHGVHPPSGALYWVESHNPMAHLDALVDVQGALTAPAVALLLEPVAEALAHAHRVGAVHGRLTLGSVSLEPSGAVRLGGFGLWRLQGAGLPDMQASPAGDVEALARVALALLTERGRLSEPHAQLRQLPPGLDALVELALPVAEEPRARLFASEAPALDARRLLREALTELDVREPKRARTELAGGLGFFFLLQRTFEGRVLPESAPNVSQRDAGAAREVSPLLVPTVLVPRTEVSSPLDWPASSNANDLDGPAASPGGATGGSAGLPPLELPLPPPEPVVRARRESPRLGRVWVGMGLVVATAIGAFALTRVLDDRRPHAGERSSENARHAPADGRLAASSGQARAPESAGEVGGTSGVHSAHQGDSAVSRGSLVPPPPLAAPTESIELVAPVPVGTGASPRRAMAPSDPPGVVVSPARITLSAKEAWLAVWDGRQEVVAASLADAELRGEALHPDWIRVRMALARRTGALEAAQQWLTHQVGTPPKREEVAATVALSALQLERGQAALAWDALAVLDAAYPGDASVRLWLGRSLEGLRQWDEAADAYLRALDVDPSLVPAALGLIRVLHRRGHLRDAHAALVARLDRTPAQKLLDLLEGELYLRGRKLRRAEECLSRYTHAQPRDWRGWFTLGVVQFRLHKLGEAIEAYARALPLTPVQSVVEHNLALAHLRVGNDVRAAELWNALAERDATDWRAPCELGRLQARAGDVEGARAHLRRVTALHPHHDWAPRAASMDLASGAARSLLGRDCAVPDHYDSLADQEVAGAQMDGLDGRPSGVDEK